jgi:hypothetical protein
MQKEDLRLLWHFTLRISMYTGKENEGRIMSFLHGYEAGRNNQCQFIEKLSDSIEKEFKIVSYATGWSGQIERTAQKFETDWVTVFKKQSLKVLTEEFPDLIDDDLIDSLKKKVIGKAERVSRHFSKDWITGWFGIVDLSADWFRKIWSKRELELMSNIEEELKSFGKIRELKEKINPTNKLKDICSQLLEEIKKDKSNYWG